jgi:Tol biopolymer transport system component
MNASRLLRDLMGAVSGASLLAASAAGQDTTRVSVGSAGGEADSYNQSPSISTDGRLVAFHSYASNLVVGDTNAYCDVFVHDRATGVTLRVSVDSSGAEANSESHGAAISADGQVVAFVSLANDLAIGDTNRTWDVYVHELASGVTELVSVDSSGASGNGPSGAPAISADGRIVAFTSWADNLVAGDTNRTIDVFVHDRATGITERVSVDSTGAEGDDSSLSPALSSDGQVVAFQSFAANLVAGDANEQPDVFVRDRSTGVTARVSVDSSGLEANARSGSPALSADGQVVAFDSSASNLVAGDANASCDVFVHDRASGATERVSVDSTGAEKDGASLQPCLSADARIVTFESDAGDLVADDANGARDVFMHDRTAGTTERVSVQSSGGPGDAGSCNSKVSADAGVVAFESSATNLVTGDGNGVADVFVHERCSTAASWSNFGAGFPGTDGVPTLTAAQNPVLGTTVSIDLSNSYGRPTLGLLLLGYQRAALHSGWGGDLLVDATIAMEFSFWYGGNTFTGDIAGDPALCGTQIDLQAIEADPGAARGVSFTPGLELVLGH